MGWSWEIAREQLDIPRIRALNEYWRTNPPVHVSVARYLGIKSTAALPGTGAAEQELAPVSDLVDDLLVGNHD